jgi:hypothetical protein
MLGHSIPDRFSLYLLVGPPVDITEKTKGGMSLKTLQIPKIPPLILTW